MGEVTVFQGVAVFNHVGTSTVAALLAWSPALCQIITEMTEEAEKLIGTREEERDDGKEEVVEKVDGESEMKTDTYDLVILGASGFTGDHSKVEKHDLV